jgi:hypothetical protein
MDDVTKGLAMTVLRRPDDALATFQPPIVLVVGVLSSHDQDVADPLPAHMRVVRFHGPTMGPVALEARALHQTSEQRQVVAIPVRQRADGTWERISSRGMASGAHLVADDSRMAAFLHDLSGYAYDPAVPLHDRIED